MASHSLPMLCLRSALTAVATAPAGARYLHVLSGKLALNLRVEDKLARLRFPSDQRQVRGQVSHNVFVTAGISLGGS